MGIINLFRKYNRAVSFRLWHVRIGGISMVLFFLFALGEKFVAKFVPMESATAEIVSEAMSFIACVILGGAIIVALYKLFARRRWLVLMMMAGGFSVGLIISAVSAHLDGNNDKIWELMPMLGGGLALFVVALILWRLSINRVKRAKFERSLTQSKHTYR